MGRYGPKPQPPLERFWPKVNKNGPTPRHCQDLGPCWEWNGARGRGGYGCFSIPPSRGVLAHRWIYKTLVGPIPDGLVIDHLCNNRCCVNPAHLKPCTTLENNLRADRSAVRFPRKSHCSRGHEFSPSNTYVTKQGFRKCRACNAINHRKHSNALVEE